MGNLYIVGTPIGNLKDISERALETLKEVDLILCEDTRTSLKLLKHFNIEKKLSSYHKFNEKQKTGSIIELLKKGSNIALISDAGMPCISDPGYILVKQARQSKINVIGIGGISASITALSISGIESDSFTFYGFFPRETKDKNKLIKEIKNSNIKTYIFYESPKRIIKTLEYINKNLGNIKISVSKELTKLNEKTYFGDIKEVLNELTQDEKSSLGEYTFIINKKENKQEEINYSLEALLIDEIIKNNISLKEAVEKLNKKLDNYSKKEIYNASLKLKDILQNI